MLKVLLADDERWVRATVKSLLPCEELDLVLVGEAGNGNEALELALRHSPDILVTDIKMPGLSGIELMAQLKEPLPNLKTVIISGYDEFALAQKALQLGAVDYLLKPVEAEQVTAVLTKIRAELAAEAERTAREKLLKKHYRISQPLFHEKIFNEIIRSDNYSPAAISQKLAACGIQFNHRCLTVICIAVDDYVTRVKHTAPENRRLAPEKLPEWFNRVARRHLHGLAFANYKTENEWVVIANPDDGQQTRKVLGAMQQAMIRRFNISFSAGISSAAHGWQSLNRQYNEAVRALQYKMVFGKNSLIDFDAINRVPAAEFYFAKDLVGEIVLNLDLLNETNLNAIIDDLCAQINGCRETTPELIKAAVWKLIVDVVTALHCPTLSPGKLYDFGTASPYETFKNLETITELNKYLKRLFRTFIADHLKKDRFHDQNVIEIARNYLDQHFTQEITLELIAGYVFVNPSYFSELFKKETGRNFIEYITALRVNKAQDLLARTPLKIYEIGAAVGYGDAKYFCKIFKKWTGLTPTEYKALHSGS